MSGVSKTFLTASSILSASSPCASDHRRSRATERIVPTGFAMP